MRLGNLGTQVVLVSYKAFTKLTYLGSEEVDNDIYYVKFFARDNSARRDYQKMTKAFKLKDSDKFILDYIRQKESK